MEQDYPQIGIWMGMPAVTLEDETVLSPLQQKIMQNAGVEGLIRCRSLLLNGKRQLAYPLPAGCARLKELAGSFSRQEGIQAVVSAAQTMRDVLENGYLQLENLVLDPEFLYVEKISSASLMVYLPIDGAGRRESGEADRRARRFLEELLAVTRLEDGFEGRVCLNYIKEKEPDAYEAANFVRDAFQSAVKEMESKRPRQKVFLTSESPLYKIRLEIVRDSHIIGRESMGGEGIDGQIRTISARHCEIIKKDSRVYVKDLGSTNGTYLNGTKLEAGREQELHEKDVLRLANVPFRVHIEGK